MYGQFIFSIARTIPEKNFGIFITTIFITIPPNYHLNKQQYPLTTIRKASKTATI